MDETTLNAIKKWYTGKALSTIETFVIPTLIEAAKLGHWQPVPRLAGKIQAALNKQTVAAKFAKANDRDRNRNEEDPEGLLDDVNDDRAHWYRAKLRGSALVHAMMFGQFRHAPECIILAANLAPFVRTDAERTALNTAAQWALDFGPVATLIEKLDRTKPAPTVRFLGTLSKTVLDNLGTAMDIQIETVRQPEIKWDWVEKLVKGKLVLVPVGTIIWPVGTRHNTSKHADKHSNCHACGHAIHNPWNWVPFVADTDNGPVSLWVGRDCAKNILGAKVDGDAEYIERGLP